MRKQVPKLLLEHELKKLFQGQGEFVEQAAIISTKYKDVKKTFMQPRVKTAPDTKSKTK